MARFGPGNPAALDRTIGAPRRVEPRRPVPLNYIDRNRRAWNTWSGPSAARARREWQTPELEWGLWNTPESELRLLDELEPGSDVIELGCGGAGVSAWLHRSGFHPVGVDFSLVQIERAGDLQQEFQQFFPLVHGNAEEIPYDRESFDAAISDYGASVWCDPVRWLPEARRLLRTDGKLIFFTPAPILLACTPADGSQPGRQLESDYFSLRYMEFGPDSGVEFQLSYGGWARLLRDTGFVIEDIIETRPDPHAEPRHPLVSTDWARRWPTEVIWIARAIPLPPVEDEAAAPA